MGIADRRRTGATKLDGAETSGLPAQVNPGGFGDEDVASAALPLERIYANGEVRRGSRTRRARERSNAHLTLRQARRSSERARCSHAARDRGVGSAMFVALALLPKFFALPARSERLA